MARRGLTRLAALVVSAAVLVPLTVGEARPAGADPVPSAPFATWADAGTRLHEDLLGATPSPARAAELEGALASGTSLGGLVEQLRQDPYHLGLVDPTTRLYRAFFLRSPDVGGLDYWVRARRDGATLVRVASQFAGSSEFVNRYGALSNRGFIELIYANVLERPGDQGGIDFWTRQLDQRRRSRGSVMVGFSESNEYRVGQAAEVSSSVLRIRLLGRAPTADELAADVAALDGGATVADVADGIVASPEYAARIARPRVVVMGDSVPFSMVQHASLTPPRPGLQVIDGSINGCDGSDAPPPARSRTGALVQPSDACRTGWSTLYPPVLAIRPDLVILVVGPHAMLDHQFDGAWRHPCHQPPRSWYRTDLTNRLSYLASAADEVVLALPAWPGPNSIWIMPSDFVKRADCVRDVMQQAATATGTPVVDLGAHVCPSGPTACDPLRTKDGIHFDPSASAGVLGWLLDAALAA